jgi:hypothetical protein
MAAQLITKHDFLHGETSVPHGTFEENAERETWDPWAQELSEVQQITLPADVMPADVFPDIESALLAAAEQLHRRPSQPELPVIADLHRRSKE